MADVVNPEILSLLACPRPACRGRLVPSDRTLDCAACGASYPISQGWPVLIPEESRRAASAQPDHAAQDESA